MKKRRAKPGDLVTRKVRGERDKRAGFVVAQPMPSRSIVWEDDGINTVKTKPLTPVTSRHDDDVSIDELREAVEHLHGVPATFVEAVEVDERFNGEIVWQGAVKVFDLAGHPSGATRAYAWSYRTEGTRRKFKAVLGVPPVDGPVMAVRDGVEHRRPARRRA